MQEKMVKSLTFIAENNERFLLKPLSWFHNAHPIAATWVRDGQTADFLGTKVDSGILVQVLHQTCQISLWWQLWIGQLEHNIADFPFQSNLFYPEKRKVKGKQILHLNTKQTFLFLRLSFWYSILLSLPFITFPLCFCLCLYTDLDHEFFIIVCLSVCFVCYRELRNTIFIQSDPGFDTNIKVLPLTQKLT